MKELKFGIVGFGYWGPNLARAIDGQPNAALVGIADSNMERVLKAVKNYPGAIGYETVNELLQSGIDALVIATPPETHQALSKLAIESGVHVLVEKPMVLDPNAGEEISQTALSKGLIYMPGHTFVYNDAVRWAKAYIESGELGKILNVYSQRLNLGQIRNDVNVVWNLAPHDISIFDFLLNSRVEYVSATGSAITQPNVEDVAFISMTYQNGVTAHSHVSWLDPFKTRTVTIIGAKGMLVIDDTSADAKIQIHEKYVSIISDTAPNFEGYNHLLTTGAVHIPKFNFSEPLHSEIADFIKAITEGVKPIANADDGIWVARVLKAVDASILSGGNQVKVGHRR